MTYLLSYEQSCEAVKGDPAAELDLLREALDEVFFVRISDLQWDGMPEPDRITWVHQMLRRIERLH